MMTALTTIGGMIPLTVQGASSIGLSYKSFGLTLIGGMTTATLLTLLVVPVFYTFFDDARAAVSGMVKQALGKRRAKTAAAEGAATRLPCIRRLFEAAGAPAGRVGGIEVRPGVPQGAFLPSAARTPWNPPGRTSWRWPSGSRGRSRS